MKKYHKQIVWVSSGFIIGILFAPLVNFGMISLYLFIVFFVLFFLFWRFNRLRLIFLFFAWLFLAFWRYHLWIPSSLAKYNGQKVEMIGTVCEEPDRRGGSQKILLCV
ncbi:hypothetical protein COX68_01350, partial [Candidatus Falkowbacteria bacterium CG_4_10_14_0_2_um_filter_41_15]